MKKMLNRYLQAYDRKPLTASLLGLLVVVVLALLSSWGIFSLSELTRLNGLIIAFLMLPVWVWLLYICTVVVMLANEWMWVTFGIYRLFRINGKPIRNSFRKWGGE